MSFRKEVNMSRKLNYKQFQEVITREVEKQLSDNQRVEVHKVTKNNNVVFDSMVIMAEDHFLSPNFYLQYYYRLYLQGQSVEEIAEIIYLSYENTLEREEEYKFDLSLEECRDKIVFRLVSWQSNEELLENVPYVPYLDMAVTFHCMVVDEGDEVGMIRVTNDLQNKWDMDIEELFKIALINTMDVFPSRIDTMQDTLIQVTSEIKGELEDFDFDDFVNYNENYMTYVVTNKRGIDGAAVILYPGLLLEIYQKMSTNYYLLPSSIHEMLAIPEYCDLHPQDLVEMVRSVNEQYVSEEEILSNHVYYFDKDYNRLRIIA